MTDQELESLEAAKINFKNFSDQNPGVSNHPFFKLAMSQLDDAIKGLGI